MLITKAWAADADAVETTTTGTMIPPAADPAAMPATPGAAEAFMWNMGLVLVLVALFYVLLIMPQQRRFKEHRSMLSTLKKGDEVVTGGGFVGKIDKIVDDHEMIIDLGNGLKVTALRSTIHARSEATFKGKAANDQKAALKDNKKQ